MMRTRDIGTLRSSPTTAPGASTETDPPLIEGGTEVVLTSEVLSTTRDRRWALVREGVIMLTLAGFIYGPTVFQIVVHNNLGEVALGIGGLGALVLAMVPIAAADCVGPAVQVIEPQASFLTGKTITGWRSIALDKIVTIRFRRTPRPGYAPYVPDFLMIADADGARLGVGTGDREALRCLADAVDQSAGRVIRMSPGALRVLDLEPAGIQHARCRDTSFMVTSVLLWLPLVAVYLLSVGNWIP